MYRNTFAERGYSAVETQEHIGFLAEPRLSTIQSTSSFGVQTQQSSYNSMVRNIYTFTEDFIIVIMS